jgi:hypothetical protein
VARLREHGSLAELDESTSRRIATPRYMEIIEVTSRSPSDLGYLQMAWADVAHCVDRGAIAIQDVEARRWWTAAEVGAFDPHRPFSAAREIAVTSEPASEERTRFTTRGMRKVGLPEFGMQVLSEERSVHWARYFLEQAIVQAAQGEPFALGDEVGPLSHGVRTRPKDRAAQPCQANRRESRRLRG